MNKTHHLKEEEKTSLNQFAESQTKVPWSTIILKIVIFIWIRMVTGQGMPVQLICYYYYRDTLVYESDNWSTY